MGRWSLSCSTMPLAFLLLSLVKPNTAYLLELASIDPASQQVAARLEIYEGGLDLPIRPK